MAGETPEEVKPKAKRRVPRWLQTVGELLGVLGPLVIDLVKKSRKP
jgi:hypothetical protein